MYKKSFYVDYYRKEKTERDGKKKYRLQETSLGLVDYYNKEKTERDGMKKYRLQETSLGGHGQVVLGRRMNFTCISAMDINDYESVTVW